MALTIGQYRYSGTGAVTDIAPVISYKSISIGGTSVDQNSFKDIQISPGNVQISPSGGQFIQDQDYYLKVEIPQDMNYNMNFDIQLTKSVLANETYQFIKNVSVERGGSGENAYMVVLYEDLDGESKAMIPLTYAAGRSNVRNSIYFQASTGYYYIGNGDTTYTRTDNYNALTVLASWKHEEGENYGVFEMTFRPIDSGFTHIHLRMVRTAEDYNIQRVQEDGSVEFGRIVDKDKIKVTLYSLNNLVGLLSSTGQLSRIGVWSHPGLVMIINGEEIRVTASGFYELDAIPITSLGVVAPNDDYTNFFTIDYEFDPEIAG